jgi:hypothetical protein
LQLTLVKKDLRSQIFGSSTKSVSSSLNDLGETEISKFQETIFMNQQVLRLKISRNRKIKSVSAIKGHEVPVNDILEVQVLEDKCDLSGVHARTP